MEDQTLSEPNLCGLTLNVFIENIKHWILHSLTATCVNLCGGNHYQMALIHLYGHPERYYTVLASAGIT